MCIKFAVLLDMFGLSCVGARQVFHDFILAS